MKSTIRNSMQLVACFALCLITSSVFGGRTMAKRTPVLSVSITPYVKSVTALAWPEIGSFRYFHSGGYLEQDSTKYLPIPTYVLRNEGVENPLVNPEIMSNLFSSSGLYPFQDPDESDIEKPMASKVERYFPNGNLEESGFVLSGKAHGIWKSYSVNGQLLTKGEFFEGKKHGNWLIWDSSGQLRIQMSYAFGKRVGNWIILDEKGRMIESRSYDNLISRN